MMRNQCPNFGMRSACRAFTLAELLMSVAVITIVILLATQLVNHATAVTRTGNKHIDTDTQARVVLDRMALDFGNMLKRTDVDYYIKQPVNYNGHGNGHGYGQKVQTGQQGSDQVAFFSQVVGYDPSQGSPSPFSLVAYRVNDNSGSASYLKLERLGKGLIWNGFSVSTNPNNPKYPKPIVFLPLTISTMWPAATDTSTDPDSQYETIGPQVFRFEYYYLLKNGSVIDVPWDTTARPTQTTITSPQSIGLTDVEAIAVAIAVIDPASRSLVSDSSLFNLASDMADFKTAPGNGANGAKKIGDMEAQWNTVLQSAAATGKTSDGSSFPPAAASAIRIYNRYFDLKTL
jgi:hypothetical protein